MYYTISYVIVVPDAPHSVSAQELDRATTAAVVVVTWEPVDGVIRGYQIIYTGYTSDKVVAYHYYGSLSQYCSAHIHTLLTV